ncbi:hypothetical protein AAMO2058_001601700 [Amorphochlora amoebiformis]
MNEVAYFIHVRSTFPGILVDCMHGLIKRDTVGRRPYLGSVEFRNPKPSRGKFRTPHQGVTRPTFRIKMNPER